AAVAPRAMTRAMISATEAKTAALLDLDIRSSYVDGRYRATGTGTDNIIVIQGRGPEANKSGGHTKLGELIARAVHDGVSRAIWRQNHLTPERHLFQRLRERGLTIGTLTDRSGCGCPGQEGETAAALEKILLDPEYAGFIELALSLSDDYEKGLLSDLSPFQDLAERVCRDISGDTSRDETGSGGDCLREMLDEEDMPEVVQIAFNALLSGLAAAGEEEAP
ncbi:MAG: adenosylcobinamide amidohydrolase, partial [Desulfosudaceae bacterium]